MLNEFEKIIPTNKEMEIQFYINNLLEELFKNKEVTVNSKKLIELLSYLTGERNISSSMKSALENKNKNIQNYIYKEKENHLKEIIENQAKIIKEKDKIINLMGEVIYNSDRAHLLIKYGIENKEQIIKDFEKIIKEGERKYENLSKREFEEY